MSFDSPAVVKADEWKKARDLLEGSQASPELGVLALQPGEILNGRQRDLEDKDFYLGSVEQMRGENLVIPPDISSRLVEAGSPSHLGFSDRNEAGFYLGSIEGYPVEIKYDQNLPDSEQWHSHPCSEVYVAYGGEVTLGFARDENFQDVFSKELEEGDSLVVGPYVKHKLLDKHNDPDLAIVRYGSEGEIAKYGPDGGQVYPWLEEHPDYSFDSATEGKNVKKTPKME